LRSPEKPPNRAPRADPRSVGRIFRPPFGTATARESLGTRGPFRDHRSPGAGPKGPSPAPAMAPRFLIVAPSPRHNPPARLSAPRLGYQTVWGAAGRDRRWLRGAFLRGFLLVRSDRPKVFQRLGQRRVLVEHTRAVVALPPTLSRFDRTEEPRHQARVGTRDETN
jgi:hypothetical protein